MGPARPLAMTVAAIALFAIGEVMQAPRFYEYVSDLAPREQVGTFMGFAFLPVAIGTFAGGIAGQLSRPCIGTTRRVLKPRSGPPPERMWLIVGSIGVVSTILMLLYDRFVAPRKTPAQALAA